MPLIVAAEATREEVVAALDARIDLTTLQYRQDFPNLYCPNCKAWVGDMYCGEIQHVSIRHDVARCGFYLLGNLGLTGKVRVFQEREGGDLILWQDEAPVGWCVSDFGGDLRNLMVQAAAQQVVMWDIPMRATEDIHVENLVEVARLERKPRFPGDPPSLTMELDRMTAKTRRRFGFGPVDR